MTALLTDRARPDRPCVRGAQPLPVHPRRGRGPGGPARRRNNRRDHPRVQRGLDDQSASRASCGRPACRTSCTSWSTTPATARSPRRPSSPGSTRRAAAASSRPRACYITTWAPPRGREGRRAQLRVPPRAHTVPPRRGRRHRARQGRRGAARGRDVVRARRSRRMSAIYTVDNVSPRGPSPHRPARPVRRFPTCRTSCAGGTWPCLGGQASLFRMSALEGRQMLAHHQRDPWSPTPGRTPSSACRSSRSLRPSLATARATVGGVQRRCVRWTASRSSGTTGACHVARPAW